MLLKNVHTHTILMSLPNGEEIQQYERQSGKKRLQTLLYADDQAKFTDDLLQISWNQLNNMVKATQSENAYI